VSGYHEWGETRVEVAGRTVALATKPGVFSHGRVDPASLLLAERAEVEAGDLVVHLNCGAGLFGVVAASGGAGRVVLADRNVLSVHAARRTLAANGAERVEVHAGQGSLALPHGLEADVVAIRVPHEKLAFLQLLRDSFDLLKVGGHCYLAGATNEGVKTAARSLERLFGNATVLAHGSSHRLVIGQKRGGEPASLQEMESPFLDPDVFREREVTLRGMPLTLHSRPGVFSWDHLDEATAILSEEMHVKPGESVLDLGCGNGALGLVAGRLSATGAVCMVDADMEALRSASHTARANGLERAEVLGSDVGSSVLERRFDVVVTNPPFHVGKATDLSVPLQFIEDAWTVLSPGGRLYLVANRTLPYERAIERRFGNLATLHDGRRFKVLSATRA
jgi:16S rRNA (guanine1207-N2)-methyltransferase